MPRALRIEFPGALYHVTAHANADERLFRHEWDREVFLSDVADVVARFGWQCYAYCLMTTHYHLLLETPVPNLGSGLQRLNGLYAQGVNSRYERAGHVFRGRYDAALVQVGRHLLEAARYVVLNPVRARACSAPDEWDWSSYRATAGLEPAPAFLAARTLLGLFAEEPEGARARYRAFVADGVGRRLLPPRHRPERAFMPKLGRR